MSISLLQNAPWLNANINSLRVNPIPLNNILGTCTFFNVDINSDNYVCNAYIYGDFVQLFLSIPSTLVDADETAITFENDLPANLSVVGNFRCTGPVAVSTNSVNVDCIINGNTLRFLAENDTIDDQFYLKCMVTYPLI